MSESETVIMYVVLGSLALWIFGALASRASRMLSYRLGQVRGRHPFQFLPIDALVIFPVLILTFLIHAFPTWGPWSALVTGWESGQLTSTGLLGAAAALVTMLLFAANHFHSIQKDSASARKYLGANTTTFGLSTSHAIQILGNGLFHTAIAALFLLPLLIPALPPIVTTPSFGTLSEVSVSTRAAAFDLWVACFAVVGLSLIFNVLQTLRTSTTKIFAPHLVEHRIEESLRREARASYSDLFRSSRAPEGRSAEQWAAQIIHHTETIPDDEQVTYLKNSIWTPGYIRFRHATLRQIERASRSTIDQNSSSEGIRERLREMRKDRSEKKSLSTLETGQSVAHGHARAMLHALVSPLLTDDAKHWIVLHCLAEARIADSILVRVTQEHSLSADPHLNEKTRSYLAKARSILTTTSSQVTTLQAPYARPPHGALPEPEIGKQTCFIFRTLSELISADRAESRFDITPAGFNELVRRADEVRHEDSRTCILEAVARHAVGATVTDRRETTKIAIDELARMSRHRGCRPKGMDSEISRATFDEFITTAAHDALLSHPRQDSEVDTNLLSLMGGRHTLAIVLHRLHYARRSNSPLSAEKLRPFYNTFLRYRMKEMTSEDATVDACLESASRFGIGDDMSRDDLAWMLETLRGEFSISTCLDLLEREKSGRLPFGLADYIHLRLTTRSATRWSGTKAAISPDHKEDILSRTPTLLQVLDGWQSIDEDSTQNIRLAFYPMLSGNPPRSELMAENGAV